MSDFPKVTGEPLKVESLEATMKNVTFDARHLDVFAADRRKRLTDGKAYAEYRTRVAESRGRRLDQTAITVATDARKGGKCACGVWTRVRVKGVPTCLACQGTYVDPPRDMKAALRHLNDHGEAYDEGGWQADGRMRPGAVALWQKQPSANEIVPRTKTHRAARWFLEVEGYDFRKAEDAFGRWVQAWAREQQVYKMHGEHELKRIVDEVIAEDAVENALELPTTTAEPERPRLSVEALDELYRALSGTRR